MSSGDEYFKKAEGKVGKFFFNDYDGAYDLYIKAAGFYKADKKWDRAGEAFMRAGDLAMKLKNQGDAASSYAECAKCLKKIDAKKATAAMDQAIKLNIENNRLASAARLLKDFAEALEQDGHFDDALVQYKRAHDYFGAEDQAQSANSCLLRMAGIYGQLDRFEDAFKMHEKLGTTYAGGTLKFQAKEQFFRAFLCRLAMMTGDNKIEMGSEARDALDFYIATDPYFRNTRESEACESLLVAVDEADEAKFEDVVQSLDELKMLDEWKSHVLLKVKKSLTDVR